MSFKTGWRTLETERGFQSRDTDSMAGFFVVVQPIRDDRGLLEWCSALMGYGSCILKLFALWSIMQSSSFGALGDSASEWHLCNPSIE